MLYLLVDSHMSLIFNILHHTDKIVDLGVIIDSKLSTRDHVVKTASKAHTVLGMIKRAVGYDSPDSVKRQLYLSHVRSVLEYCSPVWSPYLVTEIASLEKVQRRATKFILNDFSDISYRDRCIKLSLLPLSFRREIHDLCFLFNCIHGKVNCNFSNFINLVDTSTDRRSAQKGILLKIPRVKTSIFYNSYFNRTVKTWNILPDSIRASSNIDIFKRKIQEFYFNKLHTYDKS